MQKTSSFSLHSLSLLYDMRGRGLEKQLQSLTWASGGRVLPFCEWDSFTMSLRLIFYTLFKSKIKKNRFLKWKLLKGIKSENLICFQVISALAPINVERHFPFPVFGKK